MLAVRSAESIPLLHAYELTCDCRPVDPVNRERHPNAGYWTGSTTRQCCNKAGGEKPSEAFAFKQWPVSMARTSPCQ